MDFFCFDLFKIVFFYKKLLLEGRLKKLLTLTNREKISQFFIYTDILFNHKTIKASG